MQSVIPGVSGSALKWLRAVTVLPGMLHASMHID